MVCCNGSFKYTCNCLASMFFTSLFQLFLLVLVIPVSSIGMLILFPFQFYRLDVINHSFFLLHDPTCGEDSVSCYRGRLLALLVISLTVYLLFPVRSAGYCSRRLV